MAQEYSVICPNCHFKRNMRFSSIIKEAVNTTGIRHPNGKKNILRGISKLVNSTN